MGSVHSVLSVKSVGLSLIECRAGLRVRRVPAVEQWASWYETERGAGSCDPDQSIGVAQRSRLVTGRLPGQEHTVVTRVRFGDTGTASAGAPQQASEDARGGT